METDKWKMHLYFCPPLLLSAFRSYARHALCYTAIGSLEWVGRLLALAWYSDSWDFKFEVSVSGIGERERKVRTPEGNGLANGQAG